MTTLRLLLCSLLFPLLLPASRAHAQAPAVQARLREFYALYCHTLNANPNLLDEPAKLKPYVSARFLKEIAQQSKVEGGLEADPFVCAQDNDPAWEKNVEIANVKAADDGKSAKADVTLGGRKDMVRHLKVVLVKEDGVYKVDEVKATDL